MNKGTIGDQNPCQGGW